MCCWNRSPTHPPWVNENTWYTGTILTQGATAITISETKTNKQFYAKQNDVTWRVGDTVLFRVNCSEWEGKDTQGYRFHAIQLKKKYTAEEGSKC